MRNYEKKSLIKAIIIRYKHYDFCSTSLSSPTSITLVNADNDLDDIACLCSKKFDNELSQNSAWRLISNKMSHVCNNCPSSRNLVIIFRHFSKTTVMWENRRLKWIPQRSANGKVEQHALLSTRKRKYPYELGDDDNIDYNLNIYIFPES